MWTKTHHQICWVLWPPGMVSVNINSRCCLWLALGYQYGVTKWSTVCVCFCLVHVLTGGAKLHTNAGFHQYWDRGQVYKGPKYPEICSCLPTASSPPMSAWTSSKPTRQIFIVRPELLVTSIVRELIQARVRSVDLLDIRYWYGVGQAFAGWGEELSLSQSLTNQFPCVLQHSLRLPRLPQ